MRDATINTNRPRLTDTRAGNKFKNNQENYLMIFCKLCMIIAVSKAGRDYDRQRDAVPDRLM